MVAASAVVMVATAAVTVTAIVAVAPPVLKPMREPTASEGMGRTLRFWTRHQTQAVERGLEATSPTMWMIITTMIMSMTATALMRITVITVTAAM